MAARPGSYERAGGGEDGAALSAQAEASLPGRSRWVRTWWGLAAEGGYGLMAKLRVVQPALEALPPGAASIELPQT